MSFVSKTAAPGSAPVRLTVGMILHRTFPQTQMVDGPQSGTRPPIGYLTCPLNVPQPNVPCPDQQCPGRIVLAGCLSRPPLNACSTNWRSGSRGLTRHVSHRWNAAILSDGGLFVPRLTVPVGALGRSIFAIQLASGSRTVPALWRSSGGVP